MRVPRIVIYTGTSLSEREARRLLEADYRPPVKRGDLTRLLERRRVDIIGIIDGIFFDRAAVAHREILAALEQGVTVVGGSSMGALRAAELDSYGMIGVGEIYRLYREGVIDSDDEVAVTFNPDTFEPLSVPLVNVRASLQAACNRGVLTREEEEDILEVARNLFYPDRNYPVILAEARARGVITGEKERELAVFLEEGEVDLKHRDAVLVVEKIREMARAL